ncbi:hypothetical protein CJ030_MR8G007385 [Morella rubra]|uniref:Uncharacterized protein n=1 Tax=Morella rubra TaxID=262757 RepID=A0A6A1UUZ1_9ROSI|nr:hypothetical protein CJ030_MR8G007385 [Morella rubra]
MVEDRPGQQWITMRSRFEDNENIKIEATMFDGCVSVPRPEADSYGEDVRLHLSLLVDISRGDGCDELEFLCSAWPDSLEVHNVYMLKRDRMRAMPYLRPDFRYYTYRHGTCNSMANISFVFFFLSLPRFTKIVRGLKSISSTGL